MKVLLTGNKGYIGSHLQNSFAGDFDTDTLDESENFHTWVEKFHKKIDAKPNIIVHCGAIPDLNYQSPDIFLWNYEATRHIADTVANTDTHLIFFSTTAAMEPCTWYGWSKRAAEEHIRSRVPQHTILRVFNVYGREEGRETKSVPYQLKNKTLDCLFDPFIRDYIHVDDVVRSVHHSIENKIFGTHQVGTGKGTAVKDLADFIGWSPKKVTTVKEVLGSEFPEKQVATPADILPGFQATIDIFNHMEEK